MESRVRVLTALTTAAVVLAGSQWCFASSITLISNSSDKAGVVGAISRKGNVVCQVIERADTATSDRFVHETVSDKVDLIATDDNKAYGNAGLNCPHGIVRHAAGEYVHGTVHTNTLENFWSLLKSAVVGNYHQVGKNYLLLYLAEFTIRHNHRKDPNLFDNIVAGC
jgi:hypothetical protein